MKLFGSLIALLLIIFGCSIAGNGVDGVAVGSSESCQLMAGASCYQYASGGNVYSYVCQSCDGTRYEKVLATAVLNGKDADDRPCKAGASCRYDVLASNGCGG